MSTNFYFQPPKPLPSNFNQNTIVVNNPIVTNEYNNNILLHSMNNNINSQGQNNNSNGTLINNYYSLGNPSELHNTISNNNGGNQNGQKINFKTNTRQASVKTKSKVNNFNKNDLLSSGTLIRSSRSSKYNRVLKNGKKIRNIDINNEFQDMKNDDTESLSTNSIIKRKNLTSVRNSGNSKNNINLINKTNVINKKNTMNPFSKFINKIVEKITNKGQPDWQPYMNEEIKINQDIERLNHKVKSDKTKNNENNINKQENKKSKLKNDINQKENIKLEPGDKYPENLTKNSKNNTSINSNQNKSSKQTPQSNNNNIQKFKNLSKEKSNQPPLPNNNLDKASSNNNSNELSDKKSKTTKKEEDKKSESSSKIPFQPLNDILYSPKNNLNNNLAIGTFPSNINPFTSQNYNMNINESIYQNQLDNYLVSHLNEYLQNEVESKPMVLDDISNKKATGFASCSELTQAGKNADGIIKTDQDTPLISLSIGGIMGFNLFGVLDGHGPHGHFVSQFCKDYFIKNMTNYTELLKISNGLETAEGIYNELKNNKFSYINDLFIQADTEFLTQNNFDYSLSGTTCNIVFQFNQHLVCFSVGDSRGILIYDQGDSLNQGIIPLSTDHKPDLPGELERISSNGGVVDNMKDMFGNKLGPARVYKAGFNYPGLAMSRSLGDLQAKEVGVIPNPQIIEYDINPSTKYIVICSDGVWEFASNEQVRDIGNVFYAKNDVSGFCSELVNFSINLWQHFGIIRDDITVVSVFF